MRSTNVRLRRLARAGLLTRRVRVPRRHKRRRHIDTVVDDTLVSRLAWAAVEALDARLRATPDVAVVAGELVETVFGSLLDVADRQELTARVVDLVLRPR